jgi:transcriptional regulator with XRE-family HTH domain
MAKKSFKGGGADLFYTEAPTPRTDATPAKDLKINETFRALIPPLSHEEYSQLEANLIENGIREAISIWIDTVIDGHNRYEIAQKHNIPYTTVSYDFQSEADVIPWIIKNQFGRRNLTAYDRSVLALRLKPVIAEKAKENQGTRSDIPQKSARSSNEPSDIPQISARSMETRKELAEIAGVSHDTISKVEKIEQSATPEILAKLKGGDISIHKAYQEVRAQEKRNSPEDNKYFSDTLSNDEVDEIIEKALDAYFKSGGQQ